MSSLSTDQRHKRMFFLYSIKYLPQQVFEMWNVVAPPPPPPHPFKFRAPQINFFAHVHPQIQGFPQVLRTWGSSKFDGTGLKSIHGAAWEGGGGGLKMLLKNTCEGVYLIVKLPAISLQACKFTKITKIYNFFTHILQGFLLDFKLLFIVVFLEIISWKGASFFSGEWGFFSDGGASFLSGRCIPQGGHRF